MLTVKIEGLEELKRTISDMGRKQVPFATKTALNKVAKKVVDKERTVVRSVFKNPTPRTENAVKIFSGATKDRLEVVVGIDDGGGRKSFKAKGKKGTTTPAEYLIAQITGGPRVPKRFERALQAVGAMNQGDYAVFAKRSGALDAYGNISGAKLNQIISFFRTVKVDGYGGKMSNAMKMKMMKGERKGMKWGMTYFRGGRDTKLPDGIWERHYPNGMAGKSFIRPILIYIRAPSYSARFKFGEIAMDVVDREWQAEFDQAFSSAMSTRK